MTRRELEQVRHLKTEIRHDKLRLEELRTQSLCGGVDYSRYVIKGGGRSDRVCNIAVEIAAIEALIEQKMRRCIACLLEVERFISEVEDSKMRVILEQRCIRCKSWLQTAFAVGEYSESSVRSYYNRYLSNLGIK